MNEVASPGERRLLLSAWWMSGSNILAQGFAYGSLILLARWLPPASFGTVAVGTAIVYVAVLFVDRGTSPAIVLAPQLSRADLNRAVRLCVLIAVVLAAAMATTASAVVDRFATGGDAAAVGVLALCLPLHAVAVVPTALLQRTMQFRRLASLTAAGNVASALVAVAMALAGLGVWALVARLSVFFAVIAVVATVLCLSALRGDQLDLHDESPTRCTGNTERWFFLFSVMFVLTANLGYLVIGASANAGVVGLYALAFTIAMAPSTQFSEQIGKVLFAATASQPESGGLRTEQSVRLMATLLVPLLPVGIFAAPAVLPAVLGAEWTPMVVAFQILLVVGVGHAVVNCIGETLSGTGHIAFRTKVILVRCAATLSALAILVPIDGLRGAALAELAVFVPYAAVYATAGARRAGTSPAALARGTRSVAVTLGLQMVAGFAVLILLGGSETADWAAVATAAVVGLAACGPMLGRTYARMRSS